MSYDTFDYVWLSIGEFVGYVGLVVAYWFLKRKKALEERGQRRTAYVYDKWIDDGGKGRNKYFIRYWFTFRDYRYTNYTEVTWAEWESFTYVNSPIEIIFDPQNPILYNIPSSQIGQQCCHVIVSMFASIGWILGYGLGFGIGVFEKLDFKL